jgi:hypothetical protein
MVLGELSIHPKKTFEQLACYLKLRLHLILKLKTKYLNMQGTL